MTDTKVRALIEEAIAEHERDLAADIEAHRNPAFYTYIHAARDALKLRRVTSEEAS